MRLEAVLDKLPADFETMQAEARAEGHAFLDRLANDWASGAMRFDRPGEALLAAYSEGVLAAIGGITIDPIVPDALRMRRFYVRPAFRRTGIGREIAQALLKISSRADAPTHRHRYHSMPSMPKGNSGFPFESVRPHTMGFLVMIAQRTHGMSSPRSVTAPTHRCAWFHRFTSSPPTLYCASLADCCQSLPQILLRLLLSNCAAMLD